MKAYMKTSTASTDGLITTHAQNVSDFSQARRGRRRAGATIERGATTPPPTADFNRASAKTGQRGGLDQTLLRRRDIAVGRKRVQDVDEIGDPTLLGREPVYDTWHDDVRLEVGHRRALVRVVAGALASIAARRDRALQRIERILASHRTRDLEPGDSIVAVDDILRQTE